MLIYRFLKKIILKYVDIGEKKKAQEILEISEQFFMPGDLMSRVIINYAQLIYCYYFIDEKKGKNQLQDTLRFLKRIGAIDCRNTLKMQYDKRITKKNRSE